MSQFTGRPVEQRYNMRMRWGRVFKVLFWIQAGINLVGALGPEISFDALWYHLPAARMLSERGIWGVIPGGLLYTTGLPRLVTYANSLLLDAGRWLSLESPEILPKLLSYLMGLFSAHLIYRIARRYTGSAPAWAASAMWYASIVVGWQSIAAYVDLHRTFFTLLAVWFTLDVLEGKGRLSSVKSGLMWGLAYSTKILAGVDLFFMTFVLTLSTSRIARSFVVIVLLAGSIASVWGILNVVQGYHFFYPMVGVSARMPLDFSLRDSHLWSPLLLFIHPQHRTGPLLLVLGILAGKKVLQSLPKPLTLTALSLFLSWWFAPATIWKGDGRYFLPAMAVLSVSGGIIWYRLRGTRRRLATFCIVGQCLFGIVYRAIANTKFVPYIMGYESKTEFLSTHLNFAFGDWYDTDGWIGEHLGEQEYLVMGVHNTYYLPGSLWQHESWSPYSTCFPYVLIQGEPTQTLGDTEKWTPVHTVERTHTTVYETHCF